VDAVDGDATIKKLTVLAQALVCVCVTQLAVDTVLFTVVTVRHMVHKITVTAISQAAAQLVALCIHVEAVVVQYATKVVQQLTTTTAAQWPAVVVALDILTDAVVLLHSAVVFALCMVTVNNLVYADQQLYKAAAEHVM
jgi:hypothetical protein